MDTSRRRLLAASAGGGALAAMLAACGGGGDYSPAPSPPPPSPTPSCGATSISNDHGHVLAIPVADLTSPVAMTYNIDGTSGHSHSVTLSPAQLAQIATKSAITVTSTLGGSPMIHSHDLTVNCT
jgi:hypothetical protein